MEIKRMFDVWNTQQTHKQIPFPLSLFYHSFYPLDSEEAYTLYI